MPPTDAAIAAEGLSWASLGLLAAFALAAAWTPGPNNMMLASSGATFGFRRTTPHALGVALGFPVMFFAVALGFDSALDFAETELAKLHPFFARTGDAFSVLAAGMLVWFGIRIALSGRVKNEETAAASGAAGAPEAATVSGRPFTFVEAALFQWINPKAWAMTVGAATLYLQGVEPVLKAAIGAGVFLVSGLASSHVWAAFGAVLRRLLRTQRRLRAFNVAMGALVIGSVGFLFLE